MGESQSCPKFAPMKNAQLAGLPRATLEIPAKPWVAQSGRAWCWMRDVPKTKPARCEDCYFQQNMLCALNLDKPCTTFRPAERGLAPERQLAFVFRTERTTAAYAFPQPNA